MPDVDVIERRAKEHPEVAEQEIEEELEALEAEAAAPEPKPPVLDSSGAQLRFDGLDITDVEIRLVGDLMIPEASHIDQDEVRTFEIVAVHYKTVTELKKGKGGKPDERVRVQMFKPIDQDSIYIQSSGDD